MLFFFFLARLNMMPTRFSCSCNKFCCLTFTCQTALEIKHQWVDYIFEISGHLVEVISGIFTHLLMGEIGLYLPFLIMWSSSFNKITLSFFPLFYIVFERVILFLSLIIQGNSPGCNLDHRFLCGNKN